MVYKAKGRDIMKEIATNYIGKEVYVKIDRPIGSSHPKYPDHIYLVNLCSKYYKWRWKRIRLLCFRRIQAFERIYRNLYCSNSPIK